MKKNYNQPMVEVAEVYATSLMQAASPGALQNSGSGTENITTPPGGSIIGG